MTAIHATHPLSPVTPFERMLLRTAAVLDHAVSVRLERRAAGPAISRVPAAGAALDIRATATLWAPVANQLR